MLAAILTISAFTESQRITDVGYGEISKTRARERETKDWKETLCSDVCLYVGNIYLFLCTLR